MCALTHTAAPPSFPLPSSPTTCAEKSLEGSSEPTHLYQQTRP